MLMLEAIDAVEKSRTVCDTKAAKKKNVMLSVQISLSLIA